MSSDQSSRVPRPLQSRIDRRADIPPPRRFHERAPASLTSQERPANLRSRPPRPDVGAQNTQWPPRHETNSYQRHAWDNTPANNTRYRDPSSQQPVQLTNIPAFPESSRDQDYPKSNRTSISALSTNHPTSSRPSTVSSIDSTNEPPVPVPPLPLPTPAQRRNQHIRPPPSARRSGPLFYPLTSNVAPIAEESPDQSPRIGDSVRPGKARPADRRLQEDTADQNLTGIDQEVGAGADDASMRDDFATFFRKGSVAKKTKPPLTSITNPNVNAGPSATAGDRPPRAQPVGKFIFPFASSPPLSPTPSEYENERSRLEPNSRSRSPLLSPTMQSAQHSPSSTLGKGQEPVLSMSDKIPPARRPPRLNIDATREAEARGSLTSLSDLIRRATKLASNLDRGKTASRLGMLDMFNSSEKLNIEKSGRPGSGSISDILASFPPPGLTTPNTRDPASSGWPSPLPQSKLGERMSYLDSDSNKRRRKPGRRCCGMALWAFLLINLILLLLIAAAVVVPIFLIVIPRRHQAQQNAESQDSLSNCHVSTPCLNDGLSVVSGNECGCICVNGFTGDRCGDAADPGCTTSDVVSGSNNFINATLGSSIPRLLTVASANFSIPVNSTELLSLFSNSNLSCTSENALVTFNSQSSKERRFDVVSEAGDESMTELSGDSTQPLAPVITSKPELFVPLVERGVPQTVATSAGIVFQQSTETAGAATVTSTASATASSAPSSTPSGSSSSFKSFTQDTMDFARLAVLFVLEETSSLTSAINAQQKIQNFFLGTVTNGTLDLNYGDFNVTANFGTFAIEYANGTTLGGRGDGSGSLRTTGTA